jgi:hypothetical protein
VWKKNSANEHTIDGSCCHHRAPPPQQWHSVWLRSSGDQQTSKRYLFIKRRSVGGKLGLAMFRLDYLSCLLTILATVLVGRKSWTGLLISIINSLIVCLIGFRTSQFGFIPANLVCICVYAFSIRSWLRKPNTHRVSGLSVASGATPRPTGRTVRHLQWQHPVSRQIQLD